MADLHGYQAHDEVVCRLEWNWILVNARRLGAEDFGADADH